MAELGTPARYNLPASRLNIQRFPFPQDAPRLPIPAEDAILARGELVGAGIMATAEEKAAASRAQLIANIGNMLATLPQKVEESYWKGRENALRRQVMDRKSEILGRGDLAGVRFGADNSISYTPETEEDRLRLQILRNRASEVAAPDPFTEMQSRWDAPLSSSSVGAPPLEASSVPGRITDYGQPDDPYFDPNSNIKKIGAWNNPLREGSLAVSPDIAAQFRAAGIKPREPVELTLDDGTKVQTFYDDHTSQALTGRYDLYSPGGPSPLRDKKVVSFSRPGFTEPPLPVADETISLAPIGSGEAPTTTTAAALGAPPLASPTVLRPLGGIGRNPATGGFVAPLSPTQAVETTPGKQRLVEVPFKAESTAQGRRFPSIDAIIDAGMDPTGAVPQEDGTFLVKEFKPVATDVRGRGKLTDTQKTKLDAAAQLAKSIDGTMEVYDSMVKQTKAGPLGGRIEIGKRFFKVGSEEAAKANAAMEISLFKVARMLNGAGVLTDNDVERAKRVAPTLEMGRGQFKGQLEAVKGTIKDALETWLQINAGSATPEQVILANQAIQSLTGQSATTSPSTAVSAVKPEPKAGDVVGKFRFKGGNPADRTNWEPVQ